MRPTLATRRLLLEPLSEDHAELLVELDSDPEVLAHVFGRALPREEVLGTYLPKRTRPDADARGIGYWAGSAEGRFVGWWCLGVDDQDAGAAELGYRLRRDAWGHGYATEGALALLEHGFGAAGLERVWATTMVVNARSRSVLEKVGLRLVSSQAYTGAEPLPGRERGEVRYELTRSAWLGR